MRKNIFSVIIMALTAIDVILTAVMFFVMLPAFQKTNNLVTQVASVLNLELGEGDDADAAEDYTVTDIEYTDVAFDAQQTVNLKESSDGKDHYALFDGYSVGVNTKAEDYKNFGTEAITSYQSTITDIIRTVMQSHSNDDISEEVIKKETLEKIEEKFGTKCIVEVTLKNFMHQ